MTGHSEEITTFLGHLEAAGLGHRADSLMALARPSLRLLADSDAPIAVGSSRLGGSPDLPTSVSWPRNNGVPLSFIAQVNLADVAREHPDSPLPRDGLLSFFYDAVAQTAWGFDPSDRGAASVVYTAASTPAERRQPPTDLPAEGVFAAVGLRGERDWTLAPWESYDVEKLNLTRDERFAYAELFDDQDAVIHRLLGHPDPVQGDMQVECQLVTNGLYCGGSTGYDDPRAKELLHGAAQWRLLLQVDSQDEAEMMWGDVGRLYYWMKHSNLLERNWGQSWLILQCG